MKRAAAAATAAPKKPKRDYPTVGTIIEAKWSTQFGPGKEWYRGKVSRVIAGKTSSRDPSFDVAYDDGELEEKVRWENIRVVDPLSPPPCYDEPEIIASAEPPRPKEPKPEATRPRSKREIRMPQKGHLASAALTPHAPPKPRVYKPPKERAPLIIRMPRPPPPPLPIPQKKSARMVRQLVRTDQPLLDLEIVRDALRTDPVKDQADHGRVGGMLAGRIGENKYVVEYATDCRAKCKLFSCKRSLFLGELRIGKVPPRVNPLQNKRVHWYHPSCVFQSFRRASKKTKLIDFPQQDLEGWRALQPNDRAFIDLCLRRSREAPGDWALDDPAAPPPEPVDGAAVDLLLALQAPGLTPAAPRFVQPAPPPVPRFAAQAPVPHMPPGAFYGFPAPAVGRYVAPGAPPPAVPYAGRTGEYASPASPLRRRPAPPAPPDAAAYHAAVAAAAAAADPRYAAAAAAAAVAHHARRLAGAPPATDPRYAVEAAAAVAAHHARRLAGAPPYYVPGSAPPFLSQPPPQALVQAQAAAWAPFMAQAPPVPAQAPVPAQTFPYPAQAPPLPAQAPVPVQTFPYPAQAPPVPVQTFPYPAQEPLSRYVSVTVQAGTAQARALAPTAPRAPAVSVLGAYLNRPHAAFVVSAPSAAPPAAPPAGSSPPRPPPVVAAAAPPLPVAGLCRPPSSYAAVAPPPQQAPGGPPPASVAPTMRPPTAEEFEAARLRGDLAGMMQPRPVTGPAGPPPVPFAPAAAPPPAPARLAPTPVPLAPAPVQLARASPPPPVPLAPPPVPLAPAPAMVAQPDVLLASAAAAAAAVPPPRTGEGDPLGGSGDNSRVMI